MPVTAFTSGGYFDGLDLPLVLVIAFFLFFLGLVFHLQQEMKREGYPLISDRTEKTNGRVEVVGFPPMPKPKVFLQPHGREPVWVPRREDRPQIDALNAGNHHGIPLVPNGDPMLSGLGSGAWTPKIDEPDRSYDGQPVFRPLRYLEGFSVAKGDPDPRGFIVLGCDKVPAGEVVDLWIDRAEHHGRFLEIALAPDVLDRRTVAEPSHADHDAQEQPVGVVVIEEHIETAGGTIDITEVDIITAPADHDVTTGEDAISDDDAPADEARERATPPRPGHVLIPLEFAAVNGRARTIRTSAITGHQFANVPGRKADTILTAQEEQRIRGYFGAGFLYATPDRAEPFL